MTPLLEADAAAFHYPGSGRAIGPFSLTVHRGELHHLRGPSGCGKSTFARMLAGLIPHLYRGELAGAVRAGERRTVDLPLWQLTARVGIVAQNPAAQLLAATVHDEILFGLENLGLSRAETQGRLAAVLEAFGLCGLEERDPRTLSGGEQQRLVVAAIAARQPEVIVLDEAFSMLDRAAVTAVAAHVQRLRANGTAVVTFEHRSPANAWDGGAQSHVLPSAPVMDMPLPELPWRIAPFHLRVERLGVVLDGRRVLEEVDLPLASGRVVVLLGTNGAGKTTLLRALAGLQSHDGCIRSDNGSTPRLGMCFQNPDLQIFNPTVRQEIRCGNGGGDERLSRAVTQLLGLTPYEQTPPLLLSEGEKKRLGLAILLARRGLQGLCLDEPTLGQDARHRDLMGQVVRHLASTGYLCVVATHDVEWAAEWGDEFVMLHEGRVVDRRESVQPQVRDWRLACGV